MEPTYDFLTGAEVSTHRQPLRETFKQTINRPDGNNEDTRARLHALQYEVDSLKQERELAALQHQQELRDLQSRAEADFKRAQVAECAKNAATKKSEQLARDWQDIQDKGTNEKMALERKLRSVQEESRMTREELEDVQAELTSQERQSKRAFEELKQKYTALHASVETVQQEMEAKANALQTAQQRLKKQEDEVGELENEVLRLKAQAGDSETMAIIKKELSEQVTFIRRLEATNGEQLSELKRFRKLQKSIEVVEEEKHALEAKLRIMNDLRRELSEAQLQRRILEDEKKGWTSYLENEGAGKDDMKYETPEQMARAFLQERLERLSLVDKLGTIQPELSVKDEEIARLRDERTKLQSLAEELRNGADASNAPTSGDAKARLRLERQKTLMAKEIDYLRAQMRTFEAEEAEFNPEHVDEKHAKRISEVENMLEQYRSEIQTLNADLSKVESQPIVAPRSPHKRFREEDEGSEERVGELRRKARSLQDDLDHLQTRNQVLEAELQASLSQINSLKESSRTRILEFQDNPTARAENIKLSTLRTLQEENAALLEQLDGRQPRTRVVPISTLENVKLRLSECQGQMAQTEKKTLRLKQIWSSKSLEFREAVCSILGWKLDFMPNGRVKATSILYPSLIGSDGAEQENSIVFDGENGTMKVSGGPQSMFAGEIRGLIEFWVEGRKEIPCFLAACTLEFYEKCTRAQKM